MPKLRTNLKRLGAVSATAVGLSLSVAPSAWADSANTNPTSGTSSTSFQFLAPSGESCPTATSQANGDKLYSFIVDNASVPAANLGSMTWNQSTTTWSYNGYNSQGVLDDTGGNPFIGVATQNPTAGQTSGGWGAVANGPFVYTNNAAVDYEPTQSQAQTAGDDLYPGTFNIGIACVTPTGAIDGTFAYVQQTFTDTSTSPSNLSFNWSDAAASQTPEVPFAIALPIIGVGVLGGGAFMMRRRRAAAAS